MGITELPWTDRVLQWMLFWSRDFRINPEVAQLFRQAIVAVRLLERDYDLDIMPHLPHVHFALAMAEMHQPAFYTRGDQVDKDLELGPAQTEVAPGHDNAGLAPGEDNLPMDEEDHRPSFEELARSEVTSIVHSAPRALPPLSPPRSNSYFAH